MERRSFLTGLISFVAAPAIVRVSSLMPVKTMIEEPYGSFRDLIEAQRAYNDFRAKVLRSIVIDWRWDDRGEVSGIITGPRRRKLVA